MNESITNQIFFIGDEFLVPCDVSINCEILDFDEGKTFVKTRMTTFIMRNKLVTITI